MLDKSIAAIIVSYNPDPIRFGQLLIRTAAQVDLIILIDNASSLSLRTQIIQEAKRHQTQLKLNSENLGLAAGQCIGIEIARGLNIQFALFLDQDSLPAPDMVVNLLTAYQSLVQQGLQIAGVGPRLITGASQRTSPFVHFKTYAVLKQSCKQETESIQTDFLISSGMLTPIEIYKKIGLPEAALFIDNIDLEWCFRARQHGFKLYGVCNAMLWHRIGEQTHFIWAARQTGPIYIHEPVRQYYQTRNRFLLYKRSYIPWAWKLQDFPRALFKLLYFSIMIPPRRSHLRMIWLGVRDAWWGIDGPFRYKI